MRIAKTSHQLDEIKRVATINEESIEAYLSMEDGGEEPDDIKTKKRKTRIGKKKKGTEEKFVEWVVYPSKDGSITYPPEIYFDIDVTLPLPSNLDSKGRMRYEALCGGFIFYHDVIFKDYYGKKQILKNDGEVFAHQIYFEWLDKSGKMIAGDSDEIPEKVIIFITETPKPLNPNPPDPPPPPPPY